MKIAVIGGSGFIGTALVKRLLTAGHSVVILDKRKSSHFPELWKYADVRDVDTLRNGFIDIDAVYNLAAEHKDNVTPISLYYEVNVKGAQNICQTAKEFGIKTQIFTSTVAVYGFTEQETDESGTLKPFNEYGRSKLQAEEVYERWLSSDTQYSLVVIRPTVVFGETNRGNVYNLLKQIASGKFLMVGNGKNKKSMSYIENVAAFLEKSLELCSGKYVINYADKPDLDMNSLVSLVNSKLGKSKKVGIRLPYWVGYMVGLLFDLVAFVSKKEFPVSSVRIKKFCSNTQYISTEIGRLNFIPPVNIIDGLNRTIENEF